MAETLLLPSRTEGLRAGGSRSLALPARLIWKDATGAVRFASVMTKDVSDVGASVECETSAAIPLYRLVHLQFERSARGFDGLPATVRDGRVLSAVWRVAPCRRSTGTPSGYTLRFLLDPHEAARVAAAS